MVLGVSDGVFLMTVLPKSPKVISKLAGVLRGAGLSPHDEGEDSLPDPCTSFLTSAKATVLGARVGRPTLWAWPRSPQYPRSGWRAGGGVCAECGHSLPSSPPPSA